MSSESVPFLCQFCCINATRVDNNDLTKKLPVSFCPNCCSRTRKEREEDAKRRLDNRIFFYGLTQHGYQQPIREAINPRFADTVAGGPKLTDFQPTPDENGKIDYEKLSENFRYIDCYLGLVDGKHYGRFGRLRYQKVRHKRNPHGTERRFCVPLANSFNYGWWTRDLRELNKTKWYAPRQRFPAVRGEVTKFVDDMAIHDPNFIFF